MMAATERSMRALSLAGLLILLLGNPCWAQGSLQEGSEHGWDFGFWIAGATGEEHTNSIAEAQILAGGLSAGRVITHEIGSGWRRGRIEYAFGVTPLFAQVRPRNIYGVGFEPIVLRWKSGIHSSRLEPYIELAGGGLRTNTNFPFGNTSDFNFTARVGGGVQIFARQYEAMDIGCRWLHISNANLGTQNPEFNGVQLVFGYRWHR
jgi:lipid A 3-O-deacylase